MQDSNKLFDDAKANVCACYFFNMDQDEADEASLRAVIAHPQALHYLAQIHDPQPLEDFVQELRDCPQFTEAS